MVRKNGTVPFTQGRSEKSNKRYIMSNNSIQSIQTQSTDSLAGVGNAVGKDGKYSVENAFTTFKDDLTARSSENALNNLQKLSYRHTTLDTSGVGKFFLSLRQKILDACHNLRVALDSQQPALNIGVPIENLHNELSQKCNRKAIKSEFDKRSAAAKYLGNMRTELTNLKNEIDSKLSKNKYPEDTKAVLEGTQRYIDNIIDILSPNRTEKVKQTLTEAKNTAKQVIGNIKGFVGNVAKKIDNALPTDDEIELEATKLSKRIKRNANEIVDNAKHGIERAEKEIDRFFNSNS